MTKEMLINTVENQECRIAVLIDGVLEELYIERASSASHVGNIYKGRVTNVEPAIQAAFVDFGLGKNGFLHISDVHPKHFPKGQKASSEAVGKKRPHRDRPPIQECLRRGQEVVVQMTKEGIGTKGPTLTTYLSIPGRLLVMMPGMSRLGVSRKVDDDDARGKAREILAELKPPADMGFIVRTAGLDRPKKDLHRDMDYLLRLWSQVKHRIKSCRAPAEIYQESDLVIRTLRDVYNTEIDRIVCDNEAVAKRVQEFLQVAMPKSHNTVELYTGKEGLFHDAGLETEIEKIYARRVELPSGGSLVIDQAEALVAIDVNSGRFREHSDAETTATKINLMAAKEIARQLRLRDLGGVIVMDFIDMREEKNRRSVEKALREAMKDDRAKTKMTKISSFGIIEMTRQRIRPSLQRSIYRTCVHCDGSGLIKSEESVALMVMRSLQRAAALDDVAKIEVSVTPSVAHHLNNVQRRQIADMEQQTDKTIVIQANSELLAQEVRFACTSGRGTPVVWQAEPAKGQAPKPLHTAALPPLPEEPDVPGEPEEVEEFEDETQDERAMELAAKAAATIEEATAETAAAPAAPPPGESGAVQAWPAPGAQPAPRAAAPGAPGAAPGQPGQEGEGKRRRRGRRGGRRHKKRQAALAAAQAAAEAAEGLPAAPAVAMEPHAPYAPADEPVAPSQPQAAAPPAEPGQDASQVLQAIKDFVDREAQRVLQAERVFAESVRGSDRPQPAAEETPQPGQTQPEPLAASALDSDDDLLPAPEIQDEEESDEVLPAEPKPTEPAPTPLEEVPEAVTAEPTPSAPPAGPVPAEAQAKPPAPAVVPPAEPKPAHPAPASETGMAAGGAVAPDAAEAEAEDGEPRRKTRRGRRGGRRHKKPEPKAPGASQEAKPQGVKGQAGSAKVQAETPAPAPEGQQPLKPKSKRRPRRRKTAKPGNGGQAAAE